METRLTAEDARQSLTGHVAAKGAEIHTKYGPVLGWKELKALLEDRAFVRYPCELAFDAAPLEPGEFAHAVAMGDKPEDGFRLCVHPLYMLELEKVPHLVLYQLVPVNYGAFASGDDAETFGAAALGLSRDDYYAELCELADRLGAGDFESPETGGGCGCGSGCSGS